MMPAGVTADPDPTFDSQQRREAAGGQSDEMHAPKQSAIPEGFAGPPADDEVLAESTLSDTTARDSNDLPRASEDTAREED